MKTVTAQVLVSHAVTRTFGMLTAIYLDNQLLLAA